MWQLIVKHLMPPTRIVRYCCSELKERGGQGRFTVTGVRWAESFKRKRRNSLEVQTSDIKNAVMLNADNTEDRQQFENCTVKGKRIFNPIIDWTEDDVWEFLDAQGCKSNPLYQCGYKRVGCIGCPLAGAENQKKAFAQYPKYYEQYLRTFDRMLQYRIDPGKDTYKWKTGQDVMNWWLETDSERRTRKERQMYYEILGEENVQ